MLPDESCQPVATTAGDLFRGMRMARRLPRQEEFRTGYESAAGSSFHQQRNCNCRYPRHRVFTPGSPSRFRPRNPPSLALARTASRSVKGGPAARIGFGVVARRSPTAISAGETATVGD